MLLGCGQIKIGEAAHIFNVEEFDPDPFMEALNKFGLPWQESYSPDLVD